MTKQVAGEGSAARRTLRAQRARSRRASGMSSVLLAQAPNLFARHLDLEPLRGRRRGSVRCIFHEERTPSLSIDLDRGVFYCFGCGAQGGVRRFAELVGESSPGPLRLGLQEPEAERGRREVFEAADRARARLAEWRDVLAIVGWAWATRETIRRARAVSTELGETEHTVAALARAARLETLAEWAETELETALASGRVA